MNYNADIHHRQSIRLRGYDYSCAGAYFVTICTFQRECLFGEVVDGTMVVNCCGQAVQKCWEGVPDHFPDVELDAFVIMPNHMHGIIVLNNDGTHVVATGGGPKPRSIGAIVGSFKSAVSKCINSLRDSPGGTVWQRNYYERVIRNNAELHAIRQYIAGNPLNWAEDENFPARSSSELTP